MTNIHAGQRPPEPFPVSGPVDILAFIPHSLGFVPQESMVLMTMDSARLGATLRLDLPPAARDYAEFAARVTELLRADGTANGVLMALYTDRGWKRPEAPPYRRLVVQLGEHLAEAGLPIRDGWLVSARAWREYFCTDPGCCPWPGHSLVLIADSTLSAEMVYRGSAYASSLEDAVGLDQPQAWDSGGGAAPHLAGYARLLRNRWCRRSQFAGTLEVWNAYFTAAAAGERAGAGPGCPALRANPEAAGFLLASLRARPVRDSLLVMAALGIGRALEGAEACNLLSTDEGPPLLPPLAGGSARVWPAPHGARAAGSGSVPAPARAAAPDRGAAGRARLGPASDPGREFREVLVGQYPGVPDWPGLDSAFAVFAELLAATADASAGDADGEAAAALLSLLAWIEWARGRGSRAQVYLTRCLVTYPGYRLAELLEDLLTTGMFPLWARTAATAWRAPGRYPGDTGT